MLHFVLPLLKNPLTKLVAEKTIGAVTHKLKKDAIIREKEIQNAQNIDIQNIKSSDQTWRDEWLCIAFSLLLLAHFVPQLQDAMQRGWEILKLADPMFWYIILTIVGASFGVTTMNKIKKK